MNGGQIGLKNLPTFMFPVAVLVSAPSKLETSISSEIYPSLLLSALLPSKLLWTNI